MSQTRTGVRSRGSAWTMWLPCIAMALCSWLAFVDRQVLAVLSPTILKETGMSAGDFGNIVFCFFVAYTVANPVWGSNIDRVGLRIGLLLTGLLGIAWLAIWWRVARPPYLPKRTGAPAKLGFPNVLEQRFWALVFSYSLPAISAGPILTIFPLYLNRGLGVSQADLKSLLWIPPAAWGIGYFCWGWVADRFAGTNRRPVWLFLLLTALSMGLSTFVAGGFQMVALKVGSFVYPRERAA